MIDLEVPDEGKPTIKIKRGAVTRDLPADEAIEAMVKEVTQKVDEELKKVIGCSEAVLDASPEAVRTRECVLGNLTCGALRSRYGADVAIVAGGTFRSGSSYGPGDITAKDIVSVTSDMSC